MWGAFRLCGLVRVRVEQARVLCGCHGWAHPDYDRRMGPDQGRLRSSKVFCTLCVVCVVGSGAMVGCFPDAPVSFDSPAPNRRLDAIAQAGSQDDAVSLVALVEKLSATDPAERMLAIRALERREGTTLGYDHAAPEWERIEAIQRWRERLGMTDEDPGDNGSVNRVPHDAEGTQAGLSDHTVGSGVKGPILEFDQHAPCHGLTT